MPRHPFLILTLILGLSAPALAQGAPDDEAPGTRLRGLFDEMIGAVNPYLADLAEMLGDLSGWHAPELLPNGDILIRRREPQMPEDQLPEEEGPVEDPLEL